MSKIVESMPVQEVRFKDLKLLNKQTLCLIMKSLNLEVDQSLIKANLVMQLRQRLELPPLEGGDAGNDGGGAGGGDGDGAGGDGAGGDNDDDDEAEDEEEDEEGSEGEDVELSISVRLPTRRLVQIQCMTGDTVAYIKAKIRDLEGIPRNQQRISHNGIPCFETEEINELYIYDLSLRISGGGKRAAPVASAKSKEERLASQAMEASMLVNQLRSLGVPDMVQTVNFLTQQLAQSHADAIPNGVSALSLEHLRTLQSSLNTSNDEKPRIEAVMKACCAIEVQRLREMKEYLTIIDTSLRSLATLNFFKAYMLDATGRLSWESYRIMLERTIEAKCAEAGAAAARAAAA